MKTVDFSKCNRENLEFLLGGSRIAGINSLADAVDYALAEFCQTNRHEYDGGDENDLPGLCVVAVEPPITAKDRHGSFFHSWSHDDKVGPITFKQSGVPRITFRVQRADRSVKFESVAPLVDVLRVDNIVGTYSVYRHAFGATSERLYFGVTKQGWASRWKQHRCAANSGSPYLFHQAIRNDSEKPSGEFHRVIASGLSYEEAMDLEEYMVGHFSLNPRGLNMVPGGFAGIKYLGQRGFRDVGPKDWEYRSRLMREFSRHCERTGRPNPQLSLRWLDDEWASSIICSNPNNFDVAQVREARLLAEFEWTPDQIAERFSCTPERVQRLLRGSTYGRVH